MTKPLRIAMVAACPFPYPRGTPVRIFRMAQTLADLRQDIHVITYHLGNRIEPTPFITHRIPNVRFYRKTSPGPSYVKLLIIDPLLALNLIRLHRKHRYDIIHAHHAEGLLSSMPIRAFCNIPIIYDAHTLLGTELHHYNLFFRKSLQKTIGQSLDRALPRLADHVICVSEQIHSQLVQDASISPDRITIIPNGIELDHFMREESREPARARGRVNLAYAGNFARYQGIDTMLEAVSILSKSHPDVRLQLYSDDAIEGYRPLIDRLKIADRVDVFPTTFRELPERLSQADILLNPRTEGAGTPIKLINYMAAGKPIVSFAGTGHIIQHGKTGWVVPGDSPESLADGIIHLLANWELTTRLGKNARAHMEHNFSWQSRGEQIINLYGKLIQAR